jgi:hypothetical protein
MAILSLCVNPGFERSCSARLHGLRKKSIQSGFSSTGTLACAGFAALTIDAQPRVAVLLDFFRNLFSRAVKHRKIKRL